MVSLLVILLCAVLTCVSGNYLMASYDAAVEMKKEADYDIEEWRWWLTIEARDIDQYFIEIVFEGIANATTAGQGAVIARCTAAAAERGHHNVIYMDEVIMEAQESSNDLHWTVFDLLRTTNIKEQDLELFYYYHSYVMAEAYDLLYWHYYQMFDAWLEVLWDFFDNQYDLYECIDGAQL